MLGIRIRFSLCVIIAPEQVTHYNSEPRNSEGMRTTLWFEELKRIERFSKPTVYFSKSKFRTVPGSENPVCE